MPSLEQIIRPFVVDPTTPPAPYITTKNEAEPEPVRLSIGIGGSRLKDLSHDVAPIIPPSTESETPGGGIETKTVSSSYSISVSFYFTEHVREETESGE